MTFTHFQFINRDRCNTVFHDINDWTPQDWGLAIAGEAGELCNLLKKVKRGDFKLEEAKQDIAKEIADIITYCDLLMSRLNVSTEHAVRTKFNEVSKRYNSDILIVD